jgi:hypothetical protein
VTRGRSRIRTLEPIHARVGVGEAMSLISALADDVVVVHLRERPRTTASGGGILPPRLSTASAVRRAFLPAAGCACIIQRAGAKIRLILIMRGHDGCFVEER